MFPLRTINCAVVISSILLQIYIVSGQYRRVCYYTNWAQYRPKDGKYFPENMDPNLCTHIVYAFAKLNGNRLVAFEWNDESTDWMRGMYDKFNDIKKTNPEIKTLLAVGGWNMASAPFTAMVATPQSRTEFATSTVRFLRDRNFDGIDIDWEYPANRGSPPEDKYRYTMLVQETRRVFDEEARRTGRPRLLLTSAVAAGKSKIDTAYDIPQICRDMDFISLMSYDLHGSWENVTGHNSPLFPHSTETGEERYLNMDWSANYWVQKMCPKEKLVIGMGLYGRSFTLKDPYQNGLMVPVKGKGKPGKFTREGGFLAYYEVCDMLAKGGQSYYVKDQEVPYAVLGDQWVGYDDIDSLRIKVQWMKQNGFSGIMVWALDLDDYDGTKCGQGPYPLLNAINQELLGTSMARPRPRQPRPKPRPLPPKPTRPTNTWENTNTQWNPPPPPQNPSRNTKPPKFTPKQPTTTTPPNMPHLTNEFDCPPAVNSYFANPNSCNEYFICADGLSFKFKCAHPLRWSSAANFCDWPDNVVCTKTPKPVKPRPPKPAAALPPPQLPKVQPTLPPPPPPRRPQNVQPSLPRGRPNTPQQHKPQHHIPQPTRKDNVQPPRRIPTPEERRRQILREQQKRRQQQQEQQRRNQQPPPPPSIFTTRQQIINRFMTTPSPTGPTTMSSQAYPTPPWNDWYRFLSEFWKVMATLGATPPDQAGISVPGTIAGLPGPISPSQQQQPQPFCADKLDGIHPDPLDCHKYIDCVQGRAYKGSCPSNTAFDAKFGVCDYKHKIARCSTQNADAFNGF